MINKDNVLNIMRQTSYYPLSFHELVSELGINKDNDKLALSKVLGNLEKEGEIVRTRKNKYGLPAMMHLRKGVIRLHSKGYGILVPDESGLSEIFVFGKKLSGAMNNDRVIVRMSERQGKGQRPEGTVIRIISRANYQLVGIYKQRRNRAMMIPDDSRHIYPVFIRPSKKLKVKNGDRVMAQITEWPNGHSGIEGKVIEVFGNSGDPGMDLTVVMKKHGLYAGFPNAVAEEAKNKYASAIELTSDRRDLRSWNMVTIDGEDAKDLDDAVSIKIIPEGYRLGVHIADVSHYVEEGSKLDKEAAKRATSVYLVDHVLPMLPPELSNGICSLYAGEDRLALSCIMDLNQQGELLRYELCKSLIQVNERMTYTHVNSLLAKIYDEELKTRYAKQLNSFFLMADLAMLLRQRRIKRGALEFDFPETKIEVDQEGIPVGVKAAVRGPAEMLIEEFMIKANEVVAEHLWKRQMPALYRVHEKPEDEALQKVNHVLAVFGYKTSIKNISPNTYQDILQQIKGTPEEELISMILLRSMKHARYTPQALGHFGLSSKYYCHFTSPIRRYPDLIIHRVLTLILQGAMSEKTKRKLNKLLNISGEHCSIQEIKAEEAEREFLVIKKAQYMKKFVGEEFTGTISSVQSFGFFVRLENTVEGLVHISSLYDDYYIYNENNYTLLGSHNGKQYSIGDEVNVLLSRVNTEEAKIDFELVR